MREITISEIAEDFYQITVLLEQCSDFNKTRVLKDKRGMFETKFNSYLKKYNLKRKYEKNQTYLSIWKKFQKQRFNYIQCSKILKYNFFDVVARKYVHHVKHNISALNSNIGDKVFKSCFSYITFDKNQKLIKNRNYEEKRNFNYYLKNSDKLEYLDFSNFEQIFQQKIYNNKENLAFLIKCQKQIIKLLNDYGFINLLIYHEEQKDNSVLIKENLFESFLNLNNNLSDTFALFIFWLNKYIKFLIKLQKNTFDSNIEEFLLKNVSDKNDELYCFLTNKSSLNYQKNVLEYVKLEKIIEYLYNIKNNCLNYLLEMNANNNTKYLSIKKDKNKKVIVYNNPKTNIYACFHIVEKYINNTYLDEIEITEKDFKSQSIPNKAKKKALTITLWDTYYM